MRPTRERRSDATRIRHMRRLLGHSLTGFRMLEDGPSSLDWDDHVRRFARDMVRLIRAELAPRRRGGKA